MSGEWKPITFSKRDGSIEVVRFRGCAPYHAYWDKFEWKIIEYDGPKYPTEVLKDSRDGR